VIAVDEEAADDAPVSVRVNDSETAVVRFY
jgi:hypothetical protein